MTAVPREYFCSYSLRLSTQSCRTGGGKEEEDDAALHSSHSGAEAVSDRAVVASGAVRDPEPADAVGHAGGDLAAEQHRRVASQVGAPARQVHRQPGGDQPALASAVAADREQSHHAGLAAVHQQRHLQHYQHQAALDLQLPAALPQRPEQLAPGVRAEQE